MISFCLATRGRPDIFRRFYNSIMDNATRPEDIEFITYHDNDDESVYGNYPNEIRIIGPRVPNHAMVNTCYKLANGEIIAHLADDFVFETPKWDYWVLEAFNEVPDKIVFVFPNDQWYRSNFGATFFLHRNWIDTIGYLAAPYFVGHYIDNWWNEIALTTGRRKFLRNVTVRHVYAFDKVHEEYMARSKGFHSRRLFYSDEMKEKRQEDVNKLMTFAETFKQRR